MFEKNEKEKEMAGSFCIVTFVVKKGSLWVLNEIEQILIAGWEKQKQNPFLSNKTIHENYIWLQFLFKMKMMKG